MVDWTDPNVLATCNLVSDRINLYMMGLHWYERYRSSLADHKSLMQHPQLVSADNTSQSGDTLTDAQIAMAVGICRLAVSLIP